MLKVKPIDSSLSSLLHKENRVYFLCYNGRRATVNDGFSVHNPEKEINKVMSFFLIETKTTLPIASTESKCFFQGMVAGDEM